jgi:predicted outer membrane protein
MWFQRFVAASGLAVLAVSAAPDAHPTPADHEASEHWHRGAGATTELGELLGILHALAREQRAAAQLATVRTDSAELRTFAAGVETRRGALESRLASRAEAATLDLEALGDLSGARAGHAVSALQRLQELRGRAFDSAFLHELGAGLRRAIGELREEREEPGQAPALLRFVDRELGVLEEDLAAVNRLRRGAGRRGAAE